MRANNDALRLSTTSKPCELASGTCDKTCQERADRAELGCLSLGIFGIRRILTRRGVSVVGVNPDLRGG